MVIVTMVIRPSEASPALVSAMAELFVVKMVKIQQSDKYRNDIFESVLDTLKRQ